MTEENTQVEKNEQNQGINITVEQILAATVNTLGSVTIPIDKLVENYGDRSISVNQNEDKSITLNLIANNQIKEEKETAE